MKSLDEISLLFKKAMGIPPDYIELMSGARTNINYHVVANNVSYAMRVPGDGTNKYINRVCEISNLRKVSEAFDFVPDIFYANADTGLLVCEYLAGARGQARTASFFWIEVRERFRLDGDQRQVPGAS